MLLQKIYDKDITRHINPAVVVSELDQTHIHQEIEEYVFTKDIINNIYKFLNAIFNKEEGKTGVWISGYYGSGKSHFIKYLFYCLRESTREKAFEHYKAAFNGVKTDLMETASLSNVALLHNKIMRFDIEEIIFNIDAVAGSKKDINTITRVLYNQLNKRRGYVSSNLAVSTLIEKHLDQQGKLDAFKLKIKEKTTLDWNEANVRNIITMRRKLVIDSVFELDNTIDKTALDDAIKTDKDYTIEEFVRELQEYISTKDENYRLIFLMDEVSQYIGTNTDLLLNLQTVVEEVGSKIGNKVWIVCTAQQDLSNLVSNNSSRTADDFGKIKGRFETMISLESQDAAYITQKRILDKSVDGMEALSDFYKENKSFIENQFVFGHELYRNYKDDKDFYLAYPFIPYQFRLISDVFQSFSTVGFVSEGVKNTERSILGITHFTAETKKDEKIGYFIAFDDFFNEQFSNNLTHIARIVLDKAFNIEFPDNEKILANRVIKVLFMISNLTEDQRVNFPANVENITLLLLNNVNTVKTDLQQDVQKILDRLVEKNMVQQSEGKYKFLDDEGIRIANSITATTVSNDENLTYFFDHFIKSSLRPEPNINIGNRSVRVNLKIDGKLISNSGDNITIRFVVFESTDIAQEAMSVAASEMLIFINSWMMQHKQFRRDFQLWAKTAKYIANHLANASGDTLRSIKEFGAKNEILLKDLKTRFDKYFAETPFSSNNSLYDSSHISSTAPVQRYKDMVQQHVATIYRHHAMSDSLASTNAELQQKIKTTLKNPTIDQTLNKAEMEVNNRINQMGGEATLTDIVKAFDRAPYGWRDLATLQLVFNIAYKKHRSIYYQNEELDLNEYYDKAINSASRGAIDVKAVKEYDQNAVKNFKEAVSDVFMKSLTSDNQVEELIKSFKELIEQEIKDADDYNNDYVGYPFHNHIKSYVKALNQLFDIRNKEELMTDVIDHKDDLRIKRDNYYLTVSFVNDNFDAYERVKKFYDDQKQNFNRLDNGYDGYEDDFRRFFQEEDKPSDDFPVIARKHKQISVAIKDKLKELKEDVIKQYEEMFDELEAKKTELEIDNPNILPDREYHINKIKKSNSILELDNHGLTKDKIRISSLEELANAKAKTKVAEPHNGVTYVSPKKTTPVRRVNISHKITGQTIGSPDDVEKLLEKLRKQLLDELKGNDKLFIV